MENAQPTFRERLATQAVNSLQQFGLNRLAYSNSLRWLGKRLLLRNQQSPEVRAIVSGLGKGLKLLVLPGTPQSYWMGTHEPAMQAAIRAQIKPGMIVYDCGANIGYYSVMFAKIVGPQGRVYAFEPSPDSVKSLCAAAEMNNFHHLVVISNAVWSQAETLHFTRDPTEESLVSDHVEGIFGEATGTEGGIEIPAISLDEFVYAEGHPPPDLIKLDVEGSEGKAIAGARKVITEYRPHLLLEIHGKPGYEVWSILKELDYRITNIASGEVPKTVEEFAVWIRQYLAIPN